MWELVGLPERHQKCPNSELLPSPQQQPCLAGALSHLELTAAPMGTMFTKYQVPVAMEIVMKSGPQESGSMAMPADADADGALPSGCATKGGSWASLGLSGPWLSH